MMVSLTEAPGRWGGRRFEASAELMPAAVSTPAAATLAIMVRRVIGVAT